MWLFSNTMTEQKAREAAVGRHAAGRGLWLVRAQSGETVWEIRLTVRGQGQDLRIGSYPEMSVKAARREAASWRSLARRGLDPSAQQEAVRNAAARNLDQFYC